MSIAEPIVRMWTVPIGDESEPPLQFSDQLAYAFFVNTLDSAIKAEVARAVKAERKRKKAQAVIRWKRRRESPPTV
jgi:hypothetical protein